MLTADVIQSHFNDENRVKHDLENYAVKQIDQQSLPMDFFEKPRENLIIDEIGKHVPLKSNILDVGCGIGNLVRSLIDGGYEAAGIDFSEGMVLAAKQFFNDNGYSENLISQGDFLTSPDVKQYDAVILNGVIWYYDDKKSILDKIYRVLKPGGYAFIIHKNLLFNWFALNQGTISLVANEVLTHLTKDEKLTLERQLQDDIPGLAMPVKNNGTLQKSSENPLDVSELYNQSNLQVVDLAYTYIHPDIPRLNRTFDESVYADLQTKYAHQWQGLFLGSQFLVIARKGEQ